MCGESIRTTPSFTFLGARSRLRCHAGQLVVIGSYIGSYRGMPDDSVMAVVVFCWQGSFGVPVVVVEMVMVPQLVARVASHRRWVVVSAGRYWIPVRPSMVRSVYVPVVGRRL